MLNGMSSLIGIPQAPQMTHLLEISQQVLDLLRLRSIH